jgi:precorrin-8X/cobalt-precorrin-8 methylmutase
MAVVLIGHGSRLAGANDTLKDVAARVQAAGGYGAVVPAFLQMARPGIQEAIDAAATRGFTAVTVMPYFLYEGAHVSEDIPAEIEKARSRHPGVSFGMARCLGLDHKIIEAAMERIAETAGPASAAEAPGMAARPRTHPIEAESLRIISEEIGRTRFVGVELDVVKRVIHTTADFDYLDSMRFSPGAVEAGVRAIARGCAVITDVKMVEAGITRERLAPFGARVRCHSSDPDVVEEAARLNATRAATAMRKASALMAGSIVAIGNAPTALTGLLDLLDDAGGASAPALIVGVPVGFVGASEAKERLIGSGYAHIAASGRKGGSTVAAAIVNAIAIEALKTVAGGAPVCVQPG